MDLEFGMTRESLRFERLASLGEETVAIEGEATLPGSMRDAVTVLSVQAKACVQGAQAGTDEVAVRGRVCFQVLYTQGDLTRVRALETTCDFLHGVPLKGVRPAMRVSAWAAVQETEGAAANGRITLRALLGVSMEAFEDVERTVVTAVPDDPSLRVRQRTISFCQSEQLGDGETLAREEFDLPMKLGVGDVLNATAVVQSAELTGGNGRIGVSGVLEVRALHQAQEAGKPMIVTTHELPYEISIAAQLPETAQLNVEAEVTDVAVDSVADDKRRTLRVEAAVRARLTQCRAQEREIVEDLYSLEGPEWLPEAEVLELHAAQSQKEARESTRLQVTLPKDAPPIDTILTAFVQPALANVAPCGRRLDAEGIMTVTLMYLPVDSDIPYAVRLKEPFSMTFPIETETGATAQAYAIESAASAATSDRAEIRCVIGLRVREHRVDRTQCIVDIEQGEEIKREHGFVLVWPKEGESRWDTARRMRVAEEDLRAAGKRAMLAFRK